MTSVEVEKKPAFLEHRPESERVQMHHESHGDQFDTYTYTPQNPACDAPVVYAWGFATSEHVVSQFADELAQRGRIVTVVDEPNRANVPDEADEKGYRFIARNADFVEKAIDDLGYQEVDIVAHSQGSIISRIYNRRHPEKVRSIVEMAPAGQDGEGGRLRQNIGGAVEALRIAGKLFRMSTLRGIGRQAVHNTINIKNSLGQQKEIAASDERGSNLKVRRQDVRVGLIAMHADPLYKPQHLVRADAIDTASSTGRYDAVASFRRPMAGHNETFDNASETAIAVDQMLTSLNQEMDNLQPIELSRMESFREKARVRVARLMARLLSSKREEIGEVNRG